MSDADVNRVCVFIISACSVRRVSGYNVREAPSRGEEDARNLSVDKQDED